jgi:hypothetical protein
LEAIHSDQWIGYIFQYWSKNSDIHPLGIARYEGMEVSRRQKLHYYAGPRIGSAVECFAAICGDRCDHLSPSVRLLTVDLENQRVVRIYPKTGGEEKLNQSSPLERYFGRPQGQEHGNLTYIRYFPLFENANRNESI